MLRDAEYGIMVDLGHFIMSSKILFFHWQNGNDSNYHTGCWDEWKNLHKAESLVHSKHWNDHLLSWWWWKPSLLTRDTRDAVITGSLLRSLMQISLWKVICRPHICLTDWTRDLTIGVSISIFFLIFFLIDTKEQASSLLKRRKTINGIFISKCPSSAPQAITFSFNSV